MRTCRQRFALLSLALLCVGCINGNVRSFVRYEPKEDTFWFLDIYSNLRATSGADQDHLASLWKRRDAILIKPLRWLYLTADGSWELHLFSQEAIERIGKHQYRTIELDTAPAKEPAIETSGLDLAAIRVLPGQFYINEYGTLSCYHQMAVPGATVDAVLERIRPLLAKLFVKLADGEIQLAKKGERRATWEETRRAIVEQLRAADNPPIAPKSEPKAEPQKKDDPGTLLPLEAESIRLLKNAVADRWVKLHGPAASSPWLCQSPKTTPPRPRPPSTCSRTRLPSASRPAKKSPRASPASSMPCRFGLPRMAGWNFPPTW